MKISITRTDGGVSIMTLLQGGISDALKKWKDANPGKYVSHREIRPEDIPADRSGREAWTDTGAEIVCDAVKFAAMTKA